MGAVDDIERDLDEHLSGRDLPDSFRVTDDATAGWAFGKLLAATEERNRVNTVANERRAAISEWESATVKPLDDTIGFFESLLADYRRQLRDANPKAPATYKLPEGDLVWAKGSLATETVDAGLFAQFAEQHDCTDLVTYTPKVRAADLKATTHFARLPADDLGVIRFVTPDGEVVPGVQLRQKPDHVRVVAHRPVAVVTDPEAAEPLPTEPTEEIDR